MSAKTSCGTAVGCHSTSFHHAVCPAALKNLLESAGLGGAVHRQPLALRAAACCEPLWGRELLLCGGDSREATLQVTLLISCGQ